MYQYYSNIESCITLDILMFVNQKKLPPISAMISGQETINNP